MPGNIFKCLHFANAVNFEIDITSTKKWKITNFTKCYPFCCGVDEFPIESISMNIAGKNSTTPLNRYSTFSLPPPPRTLKVPMLYCRV